MRRIVFTLLATLLLITSVSVCADDTVYIGTAKELFALSQRVAGGDSMAGVSVVLTDDITLNQAFTPIGQDASLPFSGSFDGNGHTVRGLLVKDALYSGLFGAITDGTVKNLTVENATVEGNDYCGILVGRLYAYKGDALIKNCCVSGTVTGKSFVGGLAGAVLSAAYGNTVSATVLESRSRCQVKGDAFCGGMIGMAEARSIKRTATVIAEGCEAHGTVLAEGDYGTVVGGLCGAISAKDNGGTAKAGFTGCVSYAYVYGEKLAAGGFCGTVGVVGARASVSLADCSALGAVSGGAVKGGFVGKGEKEGEGLLVYANCIAAGCVIGSDSHSLGFGIIEGCTRAEDANSLPRGDYKMGDVNLDGKINSLDAALVLKVDAGLAIGGALCDFNRNGKTNSLDASAILRYDAGLIPPLN